MSFKDYYKKEVVPKLQKDFDYKNIHAVPTIKYVTVNIGLGAGLKDAKFLETTEKTLRRITGQKPVQTKARKSISGFKIRGGMIVGGKVTLHGLRMWDFLEKLIKVTCPRVRDFQGLSVRSFDGQGNYSIGFKEHIAFPEIRSDEIELIHGLQVTVGTSAKTNKEAEALLRHLGFPLKQV
ncbi:TPA: 50S ribosomal protein L5 [Candidatus Uhrbacteria bacterium]|uniref:Large ribosomal subunit protein uL5 n=2 Tax=Candidatus Uhriibacteriota TaxID=1752732 RepID=A0A0G1T732_9BACT|nr:MAG: 50S ribosomal protein L5 [Candidatus Uhrbacteria bacterium GW2011_GWF2_46_218]KKU41195.1 MAG: 50S ribosomal protein L5 [Candidatus Uhrbacteria bacterium GW2011_GWE2_46_68]HBK34042.1 50S ribosomal protein L5 [Candidatus Uhrbacteria bacterium]HCB18880.1 50S ribosomal protein L5 [Candidatus Uhrbacteria bacterium]